MAEAGAYASQPGDAAAGIYTETLARRISSKGLENALWLSIAVYSKSSQAIISSTSVCAPWNRNWPAEEVRARPCGAMCCP